MLSLVRLEPATTTMVGILVANLIPTLQPMINLPSLVPPTLQVTDQDGEI